MEKLRSIDLFAGIGGIRLGFENAFKNDIQTVYASEWDEQAVKTYKTNFNKDNFDVAGDITKIDVRDIPPFDICLAGFPCQAFSLAGQRKGFEDDYKGMARGTLFFDVARICSYHKPKVIFCENVKGLEIHDKGNTFNVIDQTLRTLPDMGYTVYAKVLNSRDYGVPQNRERIYIVAFRNDIDSSGFGFPEPIDSSKRIKDILEKEPVPVKYYLSTTYIETLRRHKERHAAKGNGFGYEIRENNDVAGAIVCGGMGRERNLLIDKRLTDFTPQTHIKGEVNREGIRKMTTREWARLQGFPETFQFPLADVHSYKQLGNSVTVSVIEAIAKEIKKVLDRDKKEVKTMRKSDNERMGNRGEWSEIYVLLRILSEGGIFPADENLIRKTDSYFPVLKAIRKNGDTVYEYKPNIKDKKVSIVGENNCFECDVAKFAEEADLLYSHIKNAKGRSFTFPDVWAFLDSINISTLKAKSDDKTDVQLELHDIYTGADHVSGFSIKSYIGSIPTLLNPSSVSTNITYSISNIPVNQISVINEQNSIKSKIEKIYELGGSVSFEGFVDERFDTNLKMVDSRMGEILAEMPLGFYLRKAKSRKCSDLIEYLTVSNPIDLNGSKERLSVFYKHKVKELLCAIALGMTPVRPWNGLDDANGGYIVAKKNGEVVTYYIYERNELKNYLLQNTKFDEPSKVRHLYGGVYEKNNGLHLDLAVQIRFV